MEGGQGGGGGWQQWTKQQPGGGCTGGMGKAVAAQSTVRFS